MGIKFYRGADKPKKIRKRFTQSRSWFRTLKWVCYHAHPNNVVGHPFKGAYPMSTAYLNHPDLKRFMLNDATFYRPPRPDAWAQGLIAGAAATQMPAFSDFFATYFGGRSFNVAEPKCTGMLENLKRCFENNSDGNAEEQCAYYVNGFERLACAN